MWGWGGGVHNLNYDREPHIVRDFQLSSTVVPSESRSTVISRLNTLYQLEIYVARNKTCEGRWGGRDLEGSRGILQALLRYRKVD
jgi:hypothetical protein